VSFSIVGRITQPGPSAEHKLQANEQVNPGDTVARLEPLRYEAAVDQANAGMQEALAAVATAKGMTAHNTARLADARNELARLEKLRLDNAANQRELEKSELNVAVAKATLDSAQARYASAQAAYESSKAASTMAGVNLQDATL